MNAAHRRARRRLLRVGVPVGESKVSYSKVRKLAAKWHG